MWVDSMVKHRINMHNMMFYEKNGKYSDRVKDILKLSTSEVTAIALMLGIV